MMSGSRRNKGTPLIAFRTNSEPVASDSLRSFAILWPRVNPLVIKIYSLTIIVKFVHWPRPCYGYNLFRVYHHPQRRYPHSHHEP